MAERPRRLSHDDDQPAERGRHAGASESAGLREPPKPIFNSGAVVLCPGSQLSTPKTNLQPASAMLHVQIGGSPLVPVSGSISVLGRTGLVSLAGPLAVDLRHRRE